MKNKVIVIIVHVPCSRVARKRCVCPQMQTVVLLSAYVEREREREQGAAHLAVGDGRQNKGSLWLKGKGRKSPSQGV